MARRLLYENSLAGSQENGALIVRAKAADATEWIGGPALRIEDGLVVVPGLDLESGSVKVDVGVEQAAYPGIAFHIADPANFELAYTQPHTSGGWDALQYDPVCHGSNSWQIHYGPRFQKESAIPIGRWYSLRLDFACGAASLSVNGGPDLFVNGLAHRHKSGMVGLWTFRPAYFRNLKVYEGGLSARPVPATPRSPHTIIEWFLEGFGVIAAEPHGLVLLNRYLPSGVTQTALTRKFNLSRDGRVEFKYGFSDIFSLAVDGVTIFSGSNTFSGIGDRDARGYAEPDAHVMAWDLKAGTHTIKISTGMKEPFGWGFGLSAAAEGLTLLPAWMA